MSFLVQRLILWAASLARLTFVDNSFTLLMGAYPFCIVFGFYPYYAELSPSFSTFQTARFILACLVHFVA